MNQERLVTVMSDLGGEKQQKLHFPMMENDEYQKAQRQEIKLGKEEGLDVSIYSNPEFNWLQMEQIRMGLKDKACVRISISRLMPTSNITGCR